MSVISQQKSTGCIGRQTDVFFAAFSWLDNLPLPLLPADLTASPLGRGSVLLPRKQGVWWRLWRKAAGLSARDRKRAHKQLYIASSLQLHNPLFASSELVKLQGAGSLLYAEWESYRIETTMSTPPVRTMRSTAGLDGSALGKDMSFCARCVSAVPACSLSSCQPSCRRIFTRHCTRVLRTQSRRQENTAIAVHQCFQHPEQRISQFLVTRPPVRLSLYV
eukprot:2047578-Rhodomonas_salina.2